MKKLALKSIKLFLTILAIALVYSGNAQTTVFSVKDGNWSDDDTWDIGVPQDGENVTITHKVFIDSEINEVPGNLTITAAETSGELLMQSDGSILFSGFINVKSEGTLKTSSTWAGQLSTNSYINISGDFIHQGGTINVGSSIDDWFTMDGTHLLMTASSKLNVTGYFHVKSGLFSASNNVEINVATITTGAFKIVDGTKINLTKGYAGIATDGITVDGILIVDLGMSISSNLGGDGLVQAAVYSFDNNPNIYGFQPENGHKATAQTWSGKTSNDLFTKQEKIKFINLVHLS